MKPIATTQLDTEQAEAAATASPATASPATAGSVTAGPATTRSRSMWRTVALVAAAVIAGLIVVRVLFSLVNPHIYSGTVLQQSEAAPPLDGLQLTTGEPVNLDSFDGEVALVFFGYTNCPDVCPMTLSAVARAMEGLDADQRDRVNMMMISVDPERDDLPFLQEYVGLFDPTFLGVGGVEADIDRAASLYGVYYEADRSGDFDESYLVDHTASLMGIGPDGVLRIIWAPDVTADALAADLNELLS